MQIKIDDITSEIMKSLTDYTSGVVEKMDKSADKISLRGARDLRGIDIKKTGTYRENWTRKKNGTEYTVHNKARYQLSHLLEKGYVMRNGKRIAGRPHIRPVEDKMVADYESEIREAIKNG